MFLVMKNPIFPPQKRKVEINEALLSSPLRQSIVEDWWCDEQVTRYFKCQAYHARSLFPSGLAILQQCII